MSRSQRASNGWGYVVRIGDTTWYDSGSIPDWFIRKFDTRRANIYMLEVLAQILAVVTLSDHLPEDWVAFIDNAAGQWALNKGYGRDSSVNGFLSAFWSMASLQSWRPTLFRVTSEANIADPISRADCTLAIRHGWKQANTKLDAILDIFAWAADDLEYVVHRAGSDLGDLEFPSFSGAGAMRKGRRTGRCAPPVPGFWGVCEPPADTAFPTCIKKCRCTFCSVHARYAAC